LSLIFTWDKILEINWKRRRLEENLNETVEGANVTVGELKGINSVVRMFLSVIEIPLYGGAVIAILSIGEANFFSRQVSYQTEPMQAIGMLVRERVHLMANFTQASGHQSQAQYLQHLDRFIFYGTKQTQHPKRKERYNTRLRNIRKTRLISPNTPHQPLYPKWTHPRV
jgi:hypothetical protein